MGGAKIMRYARYFLVATLVIYLILVWMYFKDNAQQLSSFNLLLWFFCIPLVLVGAIVLLRWRQKKTENAPAAAANTQTKTKLPQAPATHSLFVYASVCLPEGDNWSDIHDNDEDVTALSESLTDFDGVPLLVKPISRVITTPVTISNTHHADSDNDSFDQDGSDSFNEDSFDHEHPENDLNLRLAALINEQLLLSDAALSVLAQHFGRLAEQDSYEPNSALHIHPEWQARHLVSKDNEDEVLSEPVATVELAVYLCVPALADTEFLSAFVAQQLETYGIFDAWFDIDVIRMDDELALDAATTDGYQPLDFVEEQVMTLAEATTAQVCLFIAAHSQINEQWLEAQLDITAANNVPSEAGTLLIFYNEAAQHIIDIEDSVALSLTKIYHNISTANTANNDADFDSEHARFSARQYYAANLKTIKQLLIDHSFVLPPPIAVFDTQSQVTKDKRHKTDASANANASDDDLAAHKLTILSDINPATQSADLSTFMTFIDDFTARGALVNEYNLGHYMPLNLWLPPLISLALMIDMTAHEQPLADTTFLITQHKRCCLLWLLKAQESL